MSAPSTIARLPAGKVLYRPHDACPGYVVVHEGSVKVSLAAENGREIVLYRVRPGDVCLQTFGCLVNGAQYSAEAVTETEVAIEIIPVAEFQRRIVEDQEFRQQLFSAVARRFADLEQLVEDVAFTSLDARLARALIRLADGNGVVHATHEALAMEIGSARSVVSRQLGAFARDGLVDSSRAEIRIVAPHGLQSLAVHAG